MMVDLDRFEANAEVLVQRAGGLPIRLATKSLRVRSLVERLLERPGFSGLLCYSLDEALWLAEHGHTDLLVAYPSVDVEALRRLSNDERRSSRIALVVDQVAHLDLIERAAAPSPAPIRVALDIDCGYALPGRPGRAPRVLGAHRSPVRTVEQAVALARDVVQRRRFALAGLMFYDAQIAGVADTTSTRVMKRRSWADLVGRRAAITRAVGQLAPLEFVNAGGTGSLHLFGRLADDPVVTDVAAGSGLFAPTLFDHYDLPKGSSRLRPAAFYGCPVVRRHSDEVVVVASGGYLASGPAGRDRAPRPVWPSGLKLFGQEGAGEVQTPLRGRAARDLDLGDLVWFRHAKAGEVTERFEQVLLVRDGEVVESVPTYRGEGRNHG